MGQSIPLAPRRRLRIKAAGTLATSHLAGTILKLAPDVFFVGQGELAATAKEKRSFEERPCPRDAPRYDGSEDRIKLKSLRVVWRGTDGPPQTADIVLTD